MGILNKILAGISAVMGIAVLYLRGALHKERVERKDEELQQSRAAQDASSKATEALIRGLDNESTTTDRRDHNFNDD